MSYTKDDCRFLKDNNFEISPKTFKPYESVEKKNSMMKFCNNKYKADKCANYKV